MYDNSFILGYDVQWEEESTVVSCTHTLTEAATNSEVSMQATRWEDTI